MRLTIDEYCKHFKMSKEMLNSKIRAKKLNYIIEDSTTFIIVTNTPSITEKNEEIIEESKSVASQNTQISKPKITIATVLTLFQKENTFLKNKINKLEDKIDKLINDKEQMLRAERDKIEQIYSSKDEQLKNILTLVNKKIRIEREKEPLEKSNILEDFTHQGEAELVHNLNFIELKEYLKSLDIKSSQRKIIKKRFLDAYDNDSRVIHRDGKLYLDLSKYDYSDLLAY
ncbi:hypothetical protein Suden_0508 [Sulfurimonas denitrificans DSM 1251]|uniref:DUF3972 domain-containing protein n=1 Tax=Sulfurimonas denitrificans (strain ATCC 33889 / DSM 1251) TaxID=326298 RepID=Q30T93_SULDN|nr:hypothetical protein [Sulfurimonas denitrificans]ABB43788.1 hypothetical protein Suden_0508 [Sulfurimonas denitrificans DSM 1251]MDD3442459.1 hypothetical protein [Sulfurimonas denitrificans]